MVSMSINARHNYYLLHGSFYILKVTVITKTVYVIKSFICLNEMPTAQEKLKHRLSCN